MALLPTNACSAALKKLSVGEFHFHHVPAPCSALAAHENAVVDW
jgi:hypothetical protein